MHFFSANPMASVMEIKFPPGFITTEYIRDHDAMTPKIKVRISKKISRVT
jgi:hypothetical protein